MLDTARRVTGCLVACLLAVFATAQAADEAPADSPPPDPAMPKVAFEEKTGGVLLRQYELPVQSQLSYLLASGEEAVVVDPQRDVHRYLADARAGGWKITTVILTHTHADFVAGHAELSAREKSRVLTPDILHGADLALARDGATLRVGRAELEFLDTPGHASHGVSVLVRIPGAAADPAYVLTGDALRIGEVGLPDRVRSDETFSDRCHSVFDALQRVKLLPPETKMLPAHSTSLPPGPDGSERQATWSTIGRELETNPYLRTESRAAFLARMASDGAERRPYFAHCVDLNRKGPALVPWERALPPARTAADLARALAAGATVLDVRGPRPYAERHIEGSLNVGLYSRFETWTAHVIPASAALHLVGSQAQVREAVFRLHRIGHDAPRGYLADPTEAWEAGGLPLRSSGLVSPQDLSRRIDTWIEPVLVDVRPRAAFAKRRIEGSIVRPLIGQPPGPWDLRPLLDPGTSVLLVCKTGYRSSIAVGLLERQGFERIGNLEGGTRAWKIAGLPTVPETTSAR